MCKKAHQNGCGRIISSPFNSMSAVIRFVRRKSSSSSAAMSMEASPQLSRSEPSPDDHRNSNHSSGNPSISSSLPLWPTVDGPLGLTEDDSVAYARKFYRSGFALLPWLWAVNCFYFWPVLLNPRSFPQIRPYIIRSVVGFSFFTAFLCTWALTFSLGGERLFGSIWDQLLMYNLADKWGLTGWD